MHTAGRCKLLPTRAGLSLRGSRFSSLFSQMQTGGSREGVTSVTSVMGAGEGTKARAVACTYPWDQMCPPALHKMTISISPRAHGLCVACLSLLKTCAFYITEQRMLDTYEFMCCQPLPFGSPELGWVLRHKASWPPGQHS